MKRIKLLMVLIGSLLVGSDVFAQQRYEEYTNLLNGVAKPFAVGDEVTVFDTLMISPDAKAPVIATNEIINILTLSFNEPYLLKTPSLPDTFTVQVSANVFVQQAPESPDVLTTKTFTITYSRRFPYKKSDIFYFRNGRKVKAEITSITSSGISDEIVKSLLVLNNDMRINRDYDINCASCSLTGFGAYPASLTDAVDEVVINWAPHKAAELYDLEWVYIDNDAYNDNRYGSPGTLAFAERIFRFNATRVTIPGLSYKIPMLFSDAGYVFFRYRAVQELQSGERVTTQWSYQYNLSAGLGQIAFNGHQNALNWQSATSFAEEGKRKSVLQYFDGSLKERQSVTKDNSRSTTIVGSTLYDHQGKAVVNVLPAPTVNSLITYSPLINRDVNSPGSEYNKTLYDGLAQVGEECCIVAPGMATTSGASKYYSPDNPDKSTAENQYIPDAKNYPFSQTKYSQDNTGRVIAQSGVGEDFTLGSGHETKYYYGVPSQMDLDALFGTDAGDASHYQKNMVRDANGQYSVSYVDMKGKTVATALAGSSPENLAALNSNLVTQRTESLLAPSNNLVAGTSVSFTKSIVVPIDATYHFTYSLNSQTLQLPNWEGQQICYDCLYDLEIRISNDCNNKGLPGDTAFVFRKSNFSLDAINSNCSDPNRAYSETIDVALKEGSYNISKVLTINQNGKNYYRENVYLPNNNKTTFEDIYATQATLTQQNLGNCEQVTTPVEDADYYREIMYGQLKPGAVYEFLTAGKSIDFNNIDQVITLHPEYSVYTRYKELKTSNEWDAAMLKLETFDEAVQQGFLNPLQFSTAPANKFPGTNPDPFFVAGSTYYNLMKESLQNAMITQTSPATYADLWKLSNMMVKCGVVNNVIDPSCVSKYSNPANVFNDFLLCPSELDEAWTIFKSVYQAKKKSVTSKYLFAGTYPIVEDKDRVFVDPDKLFAKEYLQGIDPNEKDPNVIIAQGNEAMNNTIENNCIGYAEYWWSKLVNAGCGFEAWRDSTIIIDRLIAICKEGGDATHIFGSSTVKPGSTHAFKSFNEAIVDYVVNTPGVNQDITLCNGLIIDAPAPYDKPLMSGGKPVTDKPDECECKNIRGLNQVFQDQYTGKYSSMSVFLKEVYKTTVTQGAIDSLLSLCNNEIVCTRLPQPIVLPPILQCGFVQNACVDCQKVADAHAAFVEAYPAVAPTRENELQKNKYYAHFMYEKTGVRSTATEYLNFLDSCNATPGNFAGSIEVPDGVSGGYCIKDTLVFPSTGVVKPEWINCADMVRNYQNFLAEFPNHTWGATLRMHVEEITTTSRLKDTNPQTNLVLTQRKETPMPLALYSNESEGDLVRNEISGPQIDEDSYYVLTDTVPVSKKSMMQAMVALPPTGRWVDTTLTAHQLFTWYMSQHLGLAGYGYTAENFADWLINGCGVKMNQLPWSSEVFVSKDTLQNIWNRFNIQYSGGQLNITDTVQVPIVKGQQLSTNDPVAYYADERLSGMVWIDGDYFITRSSNVFKVSVLPKNATINSATLDMYALKDPWTFAAHFRHIDSFPFLQAMQVKGIWISGTTTFETQPFSFAGAPSHNFPYLTTDKFISFNPKDFWSNQNYLNQGVTTLVQGIYTNLETFGVNYPIQYKVNADSIETQRKFVFNGIVAPNGKSLSLTVSYTASRCDVFAAFVNNALGTFLSLDEIKEMFASKGQLLINSNCTGTTATSGCFGDTIPSTMVKVYRSDLLLCGSSVEPTFPTLPVSVLPSACKDSSSMTWLVTQEIYNYQQSLLLGNFEKAYTDKCLAAASFESLVMTSPVSEYHYTLYYYDQAGNLVQTVPPTGVRPNREVTWLTQVAEKRSLGQVQTPAHEMVTKYRYNSLNQVISQHSPDGGQSNFWYDRLGRLSISRNAEQKKTNQYSYTLYDVLGRIREVGQKQQSAGMTDAVSRNQDQLTAWVNYLNLTYPHQQVTRTVYDDLSTISGVYGSFQPRTYTMRNRVSYTQYINQMAYSGTENGYDKPNYQIYDYGSFFGYDIHGNVEVLLHDYKAGAMAANGFNRFKMINYGYDLISGKVNYVGYQAGKLDEMYHRYSYDAENRLTEVFTTHRKPFVGDRNVEEREATYNYYAHGPLARVELGTNKVQAVDYAYTLQGWLKGVNSTALNPVFDMGADGGGVTSAIGRDVIGFSLSYFMGDYQPINSTVTPFAEAGSFIGASNYKALYNGNIAYMSTGIKGLNTQLYNYKYDQLNRLVKMDTHKGFDNAGNSWSGIQSAGVFGESITYDANGNIVSYNRDGNKAASPAMDRMTYQYVAGTNKLDHIQDVIPGGAYAADIDGQSVGNYGYDDIGNLVRDNKEGLTNIEWTVYGKIKRIVKADKTIEYTYDASGNRISKTVGDLTIWYVRDAQGNTLGTYEISATDIRAKEVYLYGSSRLGSFDRNLEVNSSLELGSTAIAGIGDTYLDDQKRGQRQYELSNHLGNVLATIGDKKSWNSTLGAFEAEVKGVSDYYPFGMLMPERNYGQPENVVGMEYANTTEVNGHVVPTELSVSSRQGIEPTEYVASNSVELQNGFETGATDEIDIYIADETYAGTGNQVNGAGLSATTGSYRYGFNGKEMDNEVSGSGNQYDYGFRIYNPRIGRFLSVDPLTQSYPWYTPYQFAGNKPINSIDLDGLEEKLAIYSSVMQKSGIEKITYLEIPLQEHQQRKEWVNKGTLTKYYFYNENTRANTAFETYQADVEVQKKGFWNQLFGIKEKMPQIQVFGSGTEAQGDKPDYSKPIATFDLSNDEMFQLLNIGREGPEKYGPLSTINKFEEAVKSISKWKDAKDQTEKTLKGKFAPNTEYFYGGDVDFKGRIIKLRTDSNGNVIDTIINYNADKEGYNKKPDTIANKENPQKKK